METRKSGQPKFDSRAIRASFSRSSRNYDLVTDLHRETARELWSFIKGGLHNGQELSRENLLDIGSGTGNLLRYVDRPWRRFVCLDLSHDMNRFLKGKFAGNFQSEKIHPVTGGAEKLPFPGSVFDLVVSNLAFQWCGDPENWFREIKAVLKPGGALGFSWFGEGTLEELRKVFMKLSPEYGMGNYLHPFYSPDDLERDFSNVGFELVKKREVKRKKSYSGAAELLRALKTMGAQNASYARPRGLGRRAFIKDLIDNYDARFKTAGANEGTLNPNQDNPGVYATFAIGFFLIKRSGGRND